MLPLSPKRRSELRAEAHKLKPTVLIGDKGLTDEVLAEIDRSLKAHELIKVRAATDERDARDVWLETICERLEAHPVQQIGKIFVIYRENEDEARKEARPKEARAAVREAREERAVGKRRPRAGTLAPGASTKKRRPRSATAATPPAGKRRPRTATPRVAAPAAKRRPRAAAGKRRTRG